MILASDVTRQSLLEVIPPTSQTEVPVRVLSSSGICFATGDDHIESSGRQIYRFVRRPLRTDVPTHRMLLFGWCQNLIQDSRILFRPFLSLSFRQRQLRGAHLM